MMAVDVQGLATEVLDAGDAARSIAPPSGRAAGLGLADGYRIAAEIARRRVARGETIVGWKIGFTNRTIWDEYGVHAPIWGPVYSTTLIRAERPGEPVETALGGLVEPRIEPEIVLRFARRPAPGMTEDDILACLDGVAHGFEIVQSLFPGWRFAPADTVAAFALHGRLYCGPVSPVTDGNRAAWGAALRDFAVSLFRDGRRVDKGVAGSVLDGPLSACRHFIAAHAADGAFPRGVEPGDLVTTGTVTRAFPIAAGETWSSAIMGLELPGLALRFR